MELMKRMNAKLDLGWKMTNMDCSTCGGVTFAIPSSSIQQLYCPKCDKIYAQVTIQQDQLQDQEQLFNDVLKESGAFNINKITQNKPSQKMAYQNYEQYDYQQMQKQSKKSDQVSKKIGQKLISGWTMLQQSCEDCNVPLMKSKKGQKLCMGCDRDYAIIQMKQKTKQSLKIDKKIMNEQKVQKKNETKSIQNKNINCSENPQKKCQNQTTKQYLNRIQQKTLAFLQKQIDNAIGNNCVSALSNLLDLVQKTKDLL